MNVPGRDTVDGIDVSRWQGLIDWHAVAASGLSFAFIKASGGDGGLYVDPLFVRNARECPLPWGAYHFASRMNFDAKTEARHFCSTIRGTGWTLPPVLDWEPTPAVNVDQALAWVLAFCAEVELELGVKPIIYTGAYVSLARGPALLAYDLWLAAYTAQAPACPPWPTWTIWQHSSTLPCPGIAGTVDHNIADRAWLAAHTGHAAPAPDPGPQDHAGPFHPIPIPEDDMPAALYALSDGSAYSCDGVTARWLRDTDGGNVTAALRYPADRPVLEAGARPLNRNDSVAFLRTFVGDAAADAYAANNA